jgi:hypothetical protein
MGGSIATDGELNIIEGFSADFAALFAGQPTAKRSSESSGHPSGFGLAL